MKLTTSYDVLLSLLESLQAAEELCSTRGYPVNTVNTVFYFYLYGKFPSRLVLAYPTYLISLLQGINRVAELQGKPTTQGKASVKQVKSGVKKTNSSTTKKPKKRRRNEQNSQREK